jgi:hypothetical protein
MGVSEATQLERIQGHSQAILFWVVPDRPRDDSPGEPDGALILWVVDLNRDSAAQRSWWRSSPSSRTASDDLIVDAQQADAARRPLASASPHAAQVQHHPHRPHGQQQPTTAAGPAGAYCDYHDDAAAARGDEQAAIRRAAEQAQARAAAEKDRAAAAARAPRRIADAQRSTERTRIDAQAPAA